jgi:cytoskeletal protein CcmA (bactofilin family)
MVCFECKHMQVRGKMKGDLYTDLKIHMYKYVT